MAYKRVRVKKIAAELVYALNKRGLSVERVYLFGSYAWGKPAAHSDIDLAVVSKHFENMSDIDRIKILSDTARYLSPNIDVDIDVLGFTEKDMKKASYFDLAAQVAQKGKILFKKAA